MNRYIYRLLAVGRRHHQSFIWDSVRSRVVWRSRICRQINCAITEAARECDRLNRLADMAANPRVVWEAKATPEPLRSITQSAVLLCAVEMGVIRNCAWCPVSKRMVTA